MSDDTSNPAPEPSSDVSGKPAADGNARRFHPAAVWLGRFIGIVVVPLVFLVVLEGCLRVVGFHTPTNFFVPNQDRPGELTTNLKFGHQYFPPAIARWPRAQVIPEQKPADEVRVVVLGESAAFGTPSELYGFPHLLELILDERGDPEVNYRVINAAMTAINSHTLRQVARELERVDPDYVILYIGNNEVIGPYGSGSVFGTAFESLQAIRAMIALRKTALGQVLTGAHSAPPPAEAVADGADRWQGLANFVDHQLPADDPRVERVHHHFRENLRDIVAMSQAAGARVILCTVAVNMKDSPPFASAEPSHLSPEDLARFEELLETAGNKLLSTNREEPPVQTLRQAVELAPGHALAHYLLALALNQSADRAEDHDGQTALAEEAREHFRQAVELDTLRFRTTPRQNAIIREVAESNLTPDDHSLDLARLLAEKSPGPASVPGNNYFYEHVHFNTGGNSEVARLLANVIAPEITLPDDQQLAQWAAFTPLERARIYDRLLTGLLAQPPFITRWGAQEYLDRRRQDWPRVKAAMLTSGAVRSSFLSSRQAVRRRPQDLYLRDNLLLHAARLQQQEIAEEQARFLVEQIPGNYLAHMDLGNALLRQDRVDEAIVAYQTALDLNPFYSRAAHNLMVAQARAQAREPAPAE